MIVVGSEMEMVDKVELRMDVAVVVEEARLW